MGDPDEILNDIKEVILRQDVRSRTVHLGDGAYLNMMRIGSGDAKLMINAWFVTKTDSGTEEIIDV